MKLLAFAALPFAVLASSCYYGPAYDEQPYGAPPPPYARPGFGQDRPGQASPYYRQGPDAEAGRYGPERGGYGPESGRYQPVPPETGSRGPSRPPAPQLDPYGDPEPEPQPPSQPPARGNHPTAERTDHPNRVLSPYAPYNVIDVTGFKSGALAKDPSNGKIFRVP